MPYRKTVSIEIGPERIRAAELVNGRKNANVFNVLEFNTPEGCVDNGYITDPEKLGGMLRAFLDEAEILTANTVFSVISEDILVGGAEIERARKKSTDAEVREKARELFGLTEPRVKQEDPVGDEESTEVQNHDSPAIPADVSGTEPDRDPGEKPAVSVDDYYTAYIEQADSSGDWAMNVIIYAAPRDLIDSYYKLADFAELNILAVDYSGNSIFQWTHKAFKDESVMMIDLRRKGSTVTILTDGNLRVQVDLACRTDRLSDAIEDYEELLEMEEDTGEDEDTSDFSFAKDRVITASARLIDEVNAIASEFLSENTEEYIDVILLSSEGEGSFVVADEIEHRTGIETITLEEFPKGLMVKDLRPFKEYDPGDYIGIVGAMINPLSFRQPEEDSAARSSERKDLITRILLIFLVVCLLATAGLCVTYFILRSHNKAMDSSLDQIKYVEDIYEDYQAAEENNREIRALDQSTKQKNELLSKLFSDLEAKMPSNSKITSMNSSDDMVTFSVRAGNKESAAQFIMQLRKIAYLSEINVSDLTDTEDSAGNDSVDFTISAYLSGNASEDDEKSDGANDDGIDSRQSGNNGDSSSEGRSSGRSSDDSGTLGQTVSFHSQNA
jgi:type IV pilus assembly protein PilM